MNNTSCKILLHMVFPRETGVAVDPAEGGHARLMLRVCHWNTATPQRQPCGSRVAETLSGRWCQSVQNDSK
jgi:hypothetical protein